MASSFQIATWNVNSLKVRLGHVLQWLATAGPDVLALQELKMQTEAFPHEAFREAGYTAIVNGQKTWNGVALLLRQGTGTDIVTALPDFDDPQRRVLAATIAGKRILNLYIPNGESVGSDKYRYKLEWLARLKTFVQQELETWPDMVILGDFNIAPAPEDVYDLAQWEGQVLFSAPERAAFQDLLALGFQDCFRLHPQPDKSFSWWDYRMNAFRRKMGLRIDHILSSCSLSKHCRKCYIDVEPRRWDRPSDHAPVVAIFAEE